MSPPDARPTEIRCHVHVRVPGLDTVDRERFRVALRFAERYDFARKTVHPITTHAMSGLGTTPDDYGRTCKGARIGTGLAVRGEEARSAGADVDMWLRRTALVDQRA